MYLMLAAALLGQEAKQQEFPDLLALCPTNWGKVLYDRKTGRLALHCHKVWDAVGHVRKDGKIQVVWRLINDPEKTGPGVYGIENGRLVGVWGWYGDVYFDADGNLHGTTYGDTIYRLVHEPAPPMVPAADGEY